MREHTTKFYNSLTHTETIINLVGVPLDTKELFDIKKLISEKLNKIEKNCIERHI